MKVYVSVDMEGIGGIVCPQQTMPHHHDYQGARRLMTEEVNAVIRGLKDAGVETILVNDSHYHSLNLDISILEPSALLISGDTRPGSMMHGLDDSFDCAILLGYHAKAGTFKAVMDHSYYAKSVLDVKINGASYGEIGLNTLLAAEKGVPVVLVTGDQAAALETHDFNPACRTVSVKEAQGRFCAVCLPLTEVRNRLWDGAREAIRSIKEIPLITVPPDPVLEIEFSAVNLADAAALVPGTERVGGKGISFKCKNIQELFLWRQVFCMLAANAFSQDY